MGTSEHDAQTYSQTQQGIICSLNRGVVWGELQIHVRELSCQTPHKAGLGEGAIIQMNSSPDSVWPSGFNCLPQEGDTPV